MSDDLKPLSNTRSLRNIFRPRPTVKITYKPPKSHIRKLYTSIRNYLVNPPFYNYSGCSYLRNITYPPPPPYWSSNDPPPYDIAIQIGVIASPLRLEQLLTSPNQLE
ncbi:hypothetical protein AYI69_g3440 [Smittium culicis]|uniref:Uncharacterized protein n=1 Tax=Smittium culicis TaxID=133412 RepID=A0A1R1YJR8_9FUNG|nr:hypothetical protein AYI69_g3440 [Smittium culicis]